MEKGMKWKKSGRLEYNEIFYTVVRPYKLKKYTPFNEEKHSPIAKLKNCRISNVIKVVEYSNNGDH